MDPWHIIGWLLLAVFIGWPILAWVIRFTCGWLLWFGQRADRERMPKRYDTWRSVWGGPNYRINDVWVNDTLVVSTVANNLGGVHYSYDSWRRLVLQRRLVRID